MPEFYVDLVGRADGAGDFGPEALAETLAETLDRFFDGLFGEIEFLGDFGESGGILIAPDIVLQEVEKRAPAGGLVIGGKLMDGALELDQSPALVEERFGRGGMGGFGGSIAVRSIQGKRNGATAALQGGGTGVFVRQKMIYRSQEKGTEAPPLRVRAGDRLPGEKVGEEGLGQVLCLLGLAGLAGNEGVNRRPIELTKVLERGGGLRVLRFTRRQDDCPLRRGEGAGANWVGSRHASAFWL